MTTTAVDIHKAAWSRITRDAPCGARPFLFDFRLVNGRPFVHARPQSEPSPFTQGRTYHLIVRLAPVRRVRVHGKVVERFVGRDEGFRSWVTALLARQGLRLKHAHQIVWEDLALGKPVARNRHPHVLHTALLSFDVVVVDASLAAKAWEHGIGRHRAWGCGTLILKHAYETDGLAVAS